MDKSPAIDLPIKFDAPAVPGIDWDEMHEGYLAKLEQERLIAAVNEGLAAADAGETYTLEEVRARWEKKFGLLR